VARVYPHFALGALPEQVSVAGHEVVTPTRQPFASSVHVKIEVVLAQLTPTPAHVLTLQTHPAAA
jgi:hypothetical protein